MQPDNSRNTILFVVCAVAIFVLYELFVLRPSAERRQAEIERTQVAAEAGQGVERPSAAPGVTATPRPVTAPRREALAASARVPIVTPWLRGSIALTGARLDDLYLTRYRETLAPGSPNVELFRPEGASAAHFAEFGWTGADLSGLPGPDTPWTLAQGRVLTPSTPIVLSYVNGAGLAFTRTVAVDERYMFTITDAVANRTAAPVTLAAYGSVQRRGVPPGLAKSPILHEGAIGVLGDRLEQVKFNKWREQDQPLSRASRGGWLGITDKYWLAALVPDQSVEVRGVFRTTRAGSLDIFEANYVGPAQALAPGAQLISTNRLFAGAKRVEVLDDYERRFSIPRFDSAVDWGNLWFLTKPIFYLLHFFQGLVGNFGVAILLLTVTVKAIFFPLANKSFESMSKMKKLAPLMEDIKKRHGKDPTKQQQEVMALYQKERINPVMGCLPILIQIPVFYALYKVLFVTLEMRHAPFFGWVRDLSARDPTTFWNVFGLIPWNPASAPLLGGLLDGPLHIGVWPLLYGLSMWLQQAMQPMSADPIQKKIFQLFPIIFTFVMAPFAVGLVIYWTWSNVLTILQQWVIMRRLKVENPIDDLIARLQGPRGSPLPGE